MIYTLCFSDAEVPTVLDKQLVLQNAPSPAVSLQFFRNGVLQAAGADYVAAGYFIVPNVPPAEGDVFTCFYRYVPTVKPAASPTPAPRTN